MGRSEMTITKGDLETKIGTLLSRISKIPYPNRSHHAPQSFGDEYNQIIDLAAEYKSSGAYPEKVDVDPPWGGLPGRTWATYQQLEEYLQELRMVL